MKKEFWLIIILGIIIIILIAVLAWPVKPKVNGIEIISPKANAEISSPLIISGIVNGNGWSGFEGQVGTVSLLDSSGKQLATGVLKATSEWTTLPTNFQTTLTFQSAKAQSATLVFDNENPSGASENDREFILPVKIK